MPDLTPDEVLREIAGSGLDDAATWDDHTAPEDRYAHAATDLARQLIDAREALRYALEWVGAFPAGGEDAERRHGVRLAECRACLPENQGGGDA